MILGLLGFGIVTCTACELLDLRCFFVGLVYFVVLTVICWDCYLLWCVCGLSVVAVYEHYNTWNCEFLGLRWFVGFGIAFVLVCAFGVFCGFLLGLRVLMTARLFAGLGSLGLGFGFMTLWLADGGFFVRAGFGDFVGLIVLFGFFVFCGFEVFRFLGFWFVLGFVVLRCFGFFVWEAWVWVVLICFVSWIFGFLVVFLVCLMLRVSFEF